MIFGSWLAWGLGIPPQGPPGASEAQRRCGPAAEPGESAGGPRDPGRPPTLPVVSGVARGSLARVPGPPWRLRELFAGTGAKLPMAPPDTTRWEAC